MKLVLAIFVCLLAGYGVVCADVMDTPDQVFLDNKFSFIRVLDTFALTATEYGLVCLKYNSVREQFEPVGRLGLPSEAYTVKLTDSIAAVATWADVVYFVDISNLPTLTLRGEADLGFPLYDYALHNQSLYVANGFDGIRRYQLTDYADPEPADSSMRAVHCIQIDTRGDELLALDDYNGILRYDITNDSLTHFRDYLYLPRRASSFTLTDTALFIPLAGRGQLYLASLTADTGILTDSVNLSRVPQAVEVIDSFLISMNLPTLNFELVNTRTLGVTRLVVPGDYPDYYDGDAHTYAGHDYLYIPGGSGGICALDLSRFPYIVEPDEAYVHPGPITGLVFYDGRLVTAGTNNPIEFWVTDSTSSPVLDTAMYGMTQVRAIASSDWACFALLPVANQILALTLTEDSIRILESVDVSGSTTRDIKYIDDGPIDTLDALLSIEASRINIYAIPPDHSIQQVSTVNPGIDIQDAVVIDSFLIVSTAKSQVYAYKINRDYSATLWWVIGSPKRIRHLVPTDCVDTSASGLSAVVCGFADGAMYKIRVPRMAVGSVEYVRWLPMEVRKSVTVGGRLYTVGDGGIGVFDLSSGFPEFLEYGGYGGRMIATDGRILATSAGTAVLLYDLGPVLDPPGYDSSLAPRSGALANYPNPFNPSTSIRYVLTEATDTRLTVLNLLGQTVSVLVDRYQEAGTYEIVWNGTNDFGERVASGMYFCQLTTSGARESHKMILLK
jgi:hypothetical protein